MKTWHRFTIAAVACAAGLTLACAGKTDGGSTGDGGGSSGSSSGGAPSSCDDYFKAISGPCLGNVDLPASEIARIQGRFDTLCAEAVALPGVAITASALEACVSAVKSSGCSVLEQNPGPCSFDNGTLPTASTCVTGAQCQGGDCTSDNSAPDGGQVLCGTCVAAAGIGQSCANGLSCVAGAICNGDTGGGQSCAAITYGGAGAACNGSSTQCNLGLYCDPSTNQCAALGGTGAACQYDGACAPPLVCPAVGGPSTCQSPGAAGAPCEDDPDCVSGLGCGQSSHQCLALTFATSGQACGDSIRCLVGSCITSGTGATGNCPTVIPDGQPCNGSDTMSTCDTYANCEGGKCILGYPTCP